MTSFKTLIKNYFCSESKEQLDLDNLFSLSPPYCEAIITLFPFLSFSSKWDYSLHSMTSSVQSLGSLLCKHVKGVSHCVLLIIPNVYWTCSNTKDTSVSNLVALSALIKGVCVVLLCQMIHQLDKFYIVGTFKQLSPFLFYFTPHFLLICEVMLNPLSICVRWTPGKKLIGINQKSFQQGWYSSHSK